LVRTLAISRGQQIQPRETIMYTTTANPRHTTSDLAAGLTDLALEALARGKMPADSVEAELKLWHALEAELERDRRWQRTSPPHGTAIAVGDVLQQVVRRATRRVAGTTEQLADNQAWHADCVDGYLCQA
jgi:hypothetical protein